MTKKKTELTKITFTLDIDEFTWGELEDMESSSPTVIRETMQKYAVVEGVEDMKEFIRDLSLAQMKDFSTQFRIALTEVTNPVDTNGKN